MALKDVLQETLNEWKWEDMIEYDENENKHYINTTFNIGEQVYRFIIETHESVYFIKTFIYFPLKVPEKRKCDLSIALNRLNLYINCGHLEQIGDSIRHRNVIDVEGVEAVPQLITNMQAAATAAFRPKMAAALGAVLFTRQSVNDIIEEFEAPDDDASDARAPDFL